jgi:hypothetical protein
MNYVQRKMIAFVAALAFAIVYLPLRDQPWGTELAFCVSFTVTMFANAKRKRGKAGLLFGENRIPFSQLLFGHSLALLALIGIVQLRLYAEPYLPHWLTVPMGKTPWHSPLPSAFRYVQLIMLFILGFLESWWLTSLKTEEEKEKQSRVVWTRTALDEHMGRRLQLKEHSSARPRNLYAGNQETVED